MTRLGLFESRLEFPNVYYVSGYREPCPTELENGVAIFAWHGGLIARPMTQCMAPILSWKTGTPLSPEAVRNILTRLC